MAFRATNVHWLWLSAAIILLDQVTKQLVFRSLLKYERIELLPILNLTHLHNTGAAFSMFAEFPPWVFIVLGVAVDIARCAGLFDDVSFTIVEGDFCEQGRWAIGGDENGRVEAAAVDPWVEVDIAEVEIV